MADLARASADAHQRRESAATVSGLESKLADLAGAAAEYDVPQIVERAAGVLPGKARDRTDLRAGWSRVCDLLGSAKRRTSPAQSSGQWPTPWKRIRATSGSKPAAAWPGWGMTAPE